MRNFTGIRKTTGGLLVAAALVAGFAAPASAGNAANANIIYSSLLGNPLPGNSPSLAFESTSTSEFGNAVTFAGTNRTLSSVVLTMSSWGCVTGTWQAGDCVTPSGATFNVPITLNIYNASTDGLNPGTPITSVTQTFAIPYRPSASTKCTDASAGKWYDGNTKTCFNGLANKVTFNFSGVTLPDSVVYGIVYNTSHFGPSPITDSSACPAGGCGYDSLNVALSTSVTAGSNTIPGTTWLNSSWADAYCDGGYDGTGTFRLDSPTSACWAPYVGPAVQFKATK